MIVASVQLKVERPIKFNVSFEKLKQCEIFMDQIFETVNLMPSSKNKVTLSKPVEGNFKEYHNILYNT